MGVIMGKIIMNNTENQTQLILQAGDEESLKRQVDGIDMLERKAKAFDEISQVFKKVTIYNTATALEVKEILDKLEDN